MSHVLITVSYITRKAASDTLEGDGLHLVDDGMVAIEAATGIALIFKWSNWDLYQHSAGRADRRKLKIDLQLYLIRFVKTHSEYLHHSGANMIITGWFDREQDEIVTIRMRQDDARLVLELLRWLGL